MLEMRVKNTPHRRVHEKYLHGEKFPWPWFVAQEPTGRNLLRNQRAVKCPDIFQKIERYYVKIQTDLPC
jgi:hypothetical protein